jgi:hypothetical protein
LRKEAFKAQGNAFPMKPRNYAKSRRHPFGAAERSFRGHPGLSPLVYGQLHQPSAGQVLPRCILSLKDPEGIDFMLIRENSEGLYPGRGGYSLAGPEDPGYKDPFGRTLDFYGKESLPSA